jgi:hypothetical protein
MTDARDDALRPSHSHDTDDAMTRSEEVLEVGTVWRPGRARAPLRRIVEEEVTVTVRVRREELHVEREPVSPTRSPCPAAASGRTAS